MTKLNPRSMNNRRSFRGGIFPDLLDAMNKPLDSPIISDAEGVVLQNIFCQLGCLIKIGRTNKEMGVLSIGPISFVWVSPSGGNKEFHVLLPNALLSGGVSRTEEPVVGAILIFLASAFILPILVHTFLTR